MYKLVRISAYPPWCNCVQLHTFGSVYGTYTCTYNNIYKFSRGFFFNEHIYNK